MRRIGTVAFVLLFWGLTIAGPAQPGFAKSEDPLRNPWRIVDPLAADTAQAPHQQALKRVAHLGDPLSKVLFRRRLDTPVRRFFQSYRESFSTLDFGSLYEMEDVPWGEGEGGRKRIYFWGVASTDEYRLTQDTGLRRPTRTGHSSHLFSILPGENGYLLENRRRVNLGPLSEETLHESIRRLLVFMDFASRDVPASENLRDRYADLTRTHLPNLAGLVGKHFTVRNLGSVRRTDDGRRVNRVEVTIRAKKESFLEQYPDLYRLLDELLEPTELRVTFSDAHGNRLFRYQRDGLTWRTLYATRRGRLYPVDPESGDVRRRGLTPLEARRSGLRVRVSTSVDLLGMRFGMEDFRARGRYENGTMTWRPIERPTLDLPVGFHLLLSPFIDPFLDYLNNGENGKGLRYREGFRPTDSGVVRWEDVRLPLKDSPIVTFFLKLNFLTLEAYDEDAREDLDAFGREVSGALRKDLRRELNS